MDNFWVLEKSDILFEDDTLLAVNKKPGWLAQGDRTGVKPLTELVRDHLSRTAHSSALPYVGLVHRLDRSVSGVVLLAKTSEVCGSLNEQFDRREIKKTYWAIVANRPLQAAGELFQHLKKNSKNKSFVYDEAVPGSKPASLCYEVLACIGAYHLLGVYPLTGRHHQIRVQLASIDCPILGDQKYGSRIMHPTGAIYLHARSLTFIHPVTGQKIRLVASPPHDMLWQQAVAGLSDRKPNQDI